MRFSTALPSAAQAAYAELLDTARQRELSRSVESLSGSFNRKAVKGSTYWYYQFTDAAGGGTRQLFVGPDDEHVRALVARSRTRNTAPTEALAKAAITLGCSAATPAHFRVVRRLNEIGFFQAGGVLIGAHAFLTYGNALGAAWGELARTQDIDFAHAGNDISLALPADLRIQTRSAIESLQAGFLPVPRFRPWHKTASYMHAGDRHLRIDFLAPMVGGKSLPYEQPDLGLNLQPIRFLEFILEDIVQAAALSAVGAVLVNVPDPARFALHKMLVFADRRSRNPAKARKDLRQAAALIEVLEEFRSDDLRKLWFDLLRRGPGWRQRARLAAMAMRELIPESPALTRMQAAIAEAGRAAPPASRRKTHPRRRKSQGA